MKEPTLTKEQQRAQHVWGIVSANGGCSSGYVKLAKGLPALIMNSGLLQVLAFLQERSEKNKKKKGKDDNPHDRLLNELRGWLESQAPALKGPNFVSFMRNLMARPSGEYQRITTEAFAWLRWVRQFAAANEKEETQ